MNFKKKQKVFPIIENFCLWDFLAASPWATSLAPRLMSVYANLVHMPICGKSSSSYEYLKTQFNTCPTLKLLQIVYKVFVPVHLGAFIAHLVFTPHRKRLFLTFFHSIDLKCCMTKSNQFWNPQLKKNGKYSNINPFQYVLSEWFICTRGGGGLKNDCSLKLTFWGVSSNHPSKIEMGGLLRRDEPPGPSTFTLEPNNFFILSLNLIILKILLFENQTLQTLKGHQT